MNEGIREKGKMDELKEDKMVGRDEVELKGL